MRCLYLCNVVVRRPPNGVRRVGRGLSGAREGGAGGVAVLLLQLGLPPPPGCGGDHGGKNKMKRRTIRKTSEGAGEGVRNKKNRSKRTRRGKRGRTTTMGTSFHVLAVLEVGPSSEDVRVG